MGRFNFGQIILAYIRDAQGKTKERPALIISNDHDNHSGADLLVIAISTIPTRPCPSYHIPLPWSWNGHPVTGLNKQGFAKCNWINEIPQSKVIKSVGYAPDKELELIVLQYDRLQADEDFDDWI